jgi:plastocyanin
LRRYVQTLVVAVVLSGLASAVPAVAATPVIKGTVGPGFTITLSKKPTKPGRTTFVISDKSSIHNFHLVGPGVNKKTSVSGTGTTTWTVTLAKGTYRYYCDPHKAIMKGSFTIK